MRSATDPLFRSAATTFGRYCIAIVLGGLGSILGTMFAALFLTFQAEGISLLAGVIPGATELRGVIFGGLLISAVILFPRGVAGIFQGHSSRSWDRVLELGRRLSGLLRR